MNPSGKTIAIVCNLDTRGEEIVFVKDLIRSRGHTPILIDFSMEEPPKVSGDVTCEEVARRGGLGIETVRAYYRTNREAATNNQIAGASAIVADLLKAGRLHGIIGIGGATSTLVSTAVMHTLPFGLPKMMATPMAGHGRYAEIGVGVHDVTMHNTVVDVVKMNPLLEVQIVHAVGAICGMVEMSRGVDFHFDKPVIAERLNASTGPFTFLNPLQGWSSIDRPGRPIYDPPANARFLRGCVRSWCARMRCVMSILRLIPRNLLGRRWMSLCGCFE